MWGLFSQIQPWCRFTAATSLGWPKELWACTAETWSVFLLRGSQPDFRCFVTTGAESEHPVLVVLPAGGLQRRCKTHLLSSFSELVGPVYICTQQEKCVFRDMGPLNNTHLFFSVIYTGAPVELLRPVLLCWTAVGPVCAARRPSLQGAGRTHAAPRSATVVRSPAGNNQSSLQQAYQCSNFTWMCRRSFKVGDI